MSVIRSYTPYQVFNQKAYIPNTSMIMNEELQH